MEDLPLNIKCRGKYAGGIERFPVPNNKVSWSIEWTEYNPVDYTAPVVDKMPVWADIDFRLYICVCVCMV